MSSSQVPFQHTHTCTLVLMT